MAFAAEHDVPIPYMQRTRDYYATLGYPVYRWAHFVDVPFTPLLTPLAQLHQAVKSGRLGALTPRLHGAPTNRSQRVTVETDAPELLRRCRDDGADAVLLVPN